MSEWVQWPPVDMLWVAGVRDGVPGVREAVLQLGAYEEGEEPKDAQEFAQRILHTIYMGTENR